MDKKNKEDYAIYRLSKAKETFNSAKVLFDLKDCNGAINRSYYAIFYAIRAILAIEEKDFKKHKTVIAYFNQNYINTEIFPKKLGKKIANAQHIREDSDYDDDYKPTLDEVQLQLTTAKEVIELVEEYLNKNLKQEN